MGKKEIHSISVEEARSLALNAQGFFRSENFGKGKNGTLEIIRHLGYVQLDTLAVVARAHHHTLWSRARDYKEDFLNELMREKKIFEYWSHAAAYLPIEDFRFSLVRKNDFLKGKAHWFEKDKKMHKFVLDKIKAEGPLQAKDFEAERKHGSWFDWKPAKIALEQLFQNGKLMIVERKGFQKIYDLTERVLPSSINTTLPTREEFAEYLIRSNLRAHGIASVKDITHLQPGMSEIAKKRMKKLVGDAEIIPVDVNGIEENYFQLSNTDSKFEIKNQSEIENRQLEILSPFDNLIIRRDRLLKLFDYDFRVEFYLPEHKRKFGYFCLPVLYGNEFVAKFDVKADRGTGIFYMKSFYLEKAPQDMDAFLESFAITLKSFAKFNGCEKIVVEKIYPSKLKGEMKKALID